ncbi:MAG TPA: hypothetical protein VNJ08_17525 [Bacteriovoracaceae bacterium]|nr:hypothetical protein [Bacteriovoracaceae bacterium]
MSRLIIMFAVLMFSVTAFAQDLALSGFESRFTLVKNPEGKVTAIKLKKLVRTFSIMPFIEQLRSDLKLEQQSFIAQSDAQKEAEIDDLLVSMGLDPYTKHGNGSEEAEKLKESFMNLKNIDVDATFAALNKGDFWKEFEAKLNEAFLFIDPTVMANLEDPRFFYKRAVTYKVVMWALGEIQKRFSDIPVLNIASFVIVRVHDMMLEQRSFHHNMLLHYFEMIPETKLGMTKEELDRTVSSIFEYRIDPTNIMESNRANSTWLSYGLDNFYRQVRAGNTRVRSWQSGLSNVSFTNVKKLNFAFAQVTEKTREATAERIYHLHLTSHQFSRKPALAYDLSQPTRVKRNRALLNLAGLGLGFINMPGQLKSSIDGFIKSFYVQQVRMEGALVGHFESSGDTEMIKKIYAQRANFYIVE